MGSNATTEKHVKKALSKRLKELGVLNTNDATAEVFGKPVDHLIRGWYYMPSTNGFGEAGVWDYVGVQNTRFFTIETKHGRNTLSPHQKIKGRILTACSALRYVVASVEEAENFSFENSPLYYPETQE